MILKTKDYTIFSFREDNRAKIDQYHVKRLTQSIQERNLLELAPIIVNEKMEVIDGQHRLMAAKILGVDIYYQQMDLLAQDIIVMNVSKSWTLTDYLNFHCKHQNDEYIKLRAFMQEHGLSLKVALNIVVGERKSEYQEFKIGRFKFEDENIGKDLEVCWETINYIKKMNGYSIYTSTCRFWRALLSLVRHRDFEKSKWKVNLGRMIDHLAPKATGKDYKTMLQSIYNYRNSTKVNLLVDDI